MSFDLTKQHEFLPEKGSRQVEYTLWGAVGLLVGLLVFIPGYARNLSVWSWILFVFFVVAAFTISLNNWNLRYTKIRLSPNTIEHISRLRKVSVIWENIEIVQVHPGKIGDKIVVKSDDGTFFFDTLGEIKVKGVVKERSGFEQGEAILQTILDKVGFTDTEKHQASNYYYYSRN